MHGRLSEKNLEGVISLLGPPTILEDASSDGVSPLICSLDRNDVQVTAALLQRNRSIAVRPFVFSNTSESQVFHYPIHHAAYLVSRSDDPLGLNVLELIIKYDSCALSTG